MSNKLESNKEFASHEIHKLFEHTFTKLFLAALSLVSLSWIVMTEIRIAPIQEKLSTAEVNKKKYEDENIKLLNSWKMSQKDMLDSANLLHEYKIQLEVANKKLGTTTKDFSNKASYLEKTKIELDKARSLLTLAQSELNETTSHLNKAGLTIKEKEKLIFENSTKIEKFSSLLQERSKQLNSINSSLYEKNKKIGVISQSLKDKEQEIGKINNSLNEREKSINTITKKLDLSEKEIEKRKVEISNISTGLNTILDDMTKLSETGKNDLENLKVGINSLLEVLDSKKEELEKLKIPKIIEKIAKNSKGDFCNSTEFPFEAKVKVVEDDQNNGINAEFYIQSKVNFKKGKYTIDQAYQKTCFIEVIGNFIKDVKQQTLEYNSLQITGLFEGGADTVAKSHVGQYKGELGSTVVIDNAIVNGKKVNKSFYQGEKITNADLALLRAYSVYATFISLADSNAMKLTNRKVSFVANEFEKQGTDSRFGKITVKLFREEKKGNLTLLQ